MKDKIIVSLFFLSTWSCSQSATAPKQPVRASANSTTSGSDTDTSTGPGASNTKVMMDPNNAKVTLLSQPAVTGASKDSTLEVPGFRMKIENAHFVRMLRCAKDHKFTYLGRDIQPLMSSGTLSRENVSAAWEEASSDISLVGCDIVGDHIVREDFIDLTAGNRTTLKQEFYYVINPCVHPEYSTLKGDNCSYNLVFTDSMKFVAKYEQTFLDYARNVTDMEETISTAFAKIKALAIQMQSEAEECERLYVENISGSASRNALSQIAGMAVSATVSAFMGGASPDFVLGQGFVTNTISTVFSGNKEAPKYKCDKYEELRIQGAGIEEKLPDYIDKILVNRKQLAALNNAYAQLEADVLKKNYSRSNTVGQ